MGRRGMETVDGIGDLLVLASHYTMTLVFWAFIGMLYAVRVIVPLVVVYGLWQLFGQ